MGHKTSLQPDGDKSEQVSVPRWGQERRLEFIDFRLRWDRTVNRGELVNFFRISTQQASADLGRYAELAPQNMEYDKSLKTYRATSLFTPVIAPEDAQGYLGALSALSVGSVAASASFIGWRPAHDIVRVPARAISTEILLRILWAIRDGEELNILYQSMRRPSPAKRWIAPHALAFDGHRWHVRAWCHENAAFRDFVISRIQRVHLSRKAAVTGDADGWWHTYVDVLIRPRVGLSNGQRDAIEADFGMIRGRLKLKCRKALAFYLLRQMQLDRPCDQLPAVQPLELTNRDELAEVIVAARKFPDNDSTTNPERDERHDRPQATELPLLRRQ